MAYTDRAQRTGSRWNGHPVFRDDENNYFIRIGQYTVDVKYNGRPRPEEEILREIENTRKFTNPYRRGI